MIKWGGTTYSLHPLFIILMAAAAVTGYMYELLTLFAIVFIHELGHVACAKAFGWSITEVKLLPFGGMAETEDGALSPAWQEWVVAIAGPVQNGLMILIALYLKTMGWCSPEWADGFIQANAFIGLFNLLPILPLDGGRMMQAAYSLWMSYHRTLLIGARISLGCSVIMLLYSMYPLLTGGKLNLNLMMMALFLIWTNWEEHRNIPFRFVRFLMHRPTRLREWERAVTLGRPIVTEGGRSLSRIVRLFRRDDYHFIYVVGDEGRIVRIMPEQQLIDAFFEEPPPRNSIKE
ncbi:site-2 protease family protein [Paenibacillus alvei]|uniref:site-2 protease family protein n=1 Tax=Paenibacillus TaxID=44249 RepID=UPI0002888B51|nr:MULTISPECIES: site-2 protease family protein [Paenibacillus]EJW17055.1 protease (processing of pro-sigma-K to active sigma-K) [Paenibacillus alvei DSM 29]MCY9542711.1 site-2 protease family protein [Paenibacillus alvei]MCY9707911.1 site-2 protease family protein [Paenibacillus alvei]MCY9736643.1 site-2 protease family protein [Paenibacillus alvei]MCY9753672.1 site-2 protease family protein [Paenibacillus alvei]